MKTIGYVRVSTDKQLENTSLENQKTKIERFCLLNDLVLDSIESDTQSGFNIDRPGFQSAIRQVLENPGSTIIFYKIDRFSRNMLDSLETFKMLVNYNVRVVFLEEGIDSFSAMGKFMMNLLLSMFSLMAEWEREQILERTRSGREFAKANGRKYTREPRYGYSQSKDSKDLTEHAGELAAVERAKALREHGFTYSDICTQLKKDGFKPRRGKEWSTSVVYSICNGYTKKVKVVESERLAQLRQNFLDSKGCADGSTDA